MKIEEIPFSFSTYKLLLEKTLDHNFKGIVTGDAKLLTYFDHVNSPRGITSLKLMKQFTGFRPLSFSFPHSHFLIEEYNEIIRRLRDSGIINFWYELFIRKNEKVEAFGPEVLTLDQLRVGFIACLIPLSMSFVAFVCELIINRLALKVFELCKREVASFKLLFK